MDHEQDPEGGSEDEVHSWFASLREEVVRATADFQERVSRALRDADATRGRGGGTLVSLVGRALVESLNLLSSLLGGAERPSSHAGELGPTSGRESDESEEHDPAQSLRDEAHPGE